MSSISTCEYIYSIYNIPSQKLTILTAALCCTSWFTAYVQIQPTHMKNCINMHVDRQLLRQYRITHVYRQTEMDSEGLQHTWMTGHPCVLQIVPRDAAAFLRIRPLASLGFKHGNVGLGLARRLDTTLCYVLMGSPLVFACASLFLVTQESQLNPSTCFGLLGEPDGWSLLQLSRLVNTNMKICTGPQVICRNCPSPSKLKPTK